MFFWLPYLSPKSFGFSCIRLLVCFRVISPHQLLVEFSFVALECPCFVCIVLLFVDISLICLLSPILFGLFPQIVLLFFSRVAFSFLFLHIQASFFCFIILACFRRFFFCVSCRISHPGFDSFFMLFEGYYYCYLHWSFSHQRQLMVFHWSLSDNKFPQVSRTLLSWSPLLLLLLLFQFTGICFMLLEHLSTKKNLVTMCQF